MGTLAAAQGHPAYVLVLLRLIYGLERLSLLRMFLGQISSPVSCGLNPDHRHLPLGGMLSLANLGFLLGPEDKTRSGNAPGTAPLSRSGTFTIFPLHDYFCHAMICGLSLLPVLPISSSWLVTITKTGQLVSLNVFILGVVSTRCKAKPQVMPEHKLSISAQLGRKVENMRPLAARRALGGGRGHFTYPKQLE